MGRSPLRIIRIQTGCTYAKITGPDLLQPDQEGTFEVVINPKNVPQKLTTATAILFTDSPRTPQVYLTIAGAAKRFAMLSADICDFGEIIHQNDASKENKTMCKCTIKS